MGFGPVDAGSNPAPLTSSLRESEVELDFGVHESHGLILLTTLIR